MVTARKQPAPRYAIPREVVERVERKLLARFLTPFASELSAAAIDLAALGETHQDDREVVHVLYDFLHAPSPGAPSSLVANLVAIAGVANPATCEQLARLDVEARLPRGRGCEDMAFTAFLDHPELFARAKPFASVPAARGYSECEPGDARPFAAPRAKLDELERRLGKVLEKRGRTHYCKVLATTTPAETILDVAYGKLPAARDRIVAESESLRVEQETRVNTDSARVLVDLATGRAAFSGYPFMKELLRHQLGDLLFGDAAFYRGGSIVTLEPLRQDLDGTLVPDGVRGLKSVQLQSITLRRGDYPGPTYPAGPTGDARDTIDAVHLRAALAWKGSVSHATLSLHTEHRPRPTSLALRARDAHLDFDRNDALLETIVREWLEARGILDMPLRESMREAS
jgi:hypothetical protein